MSDHTHGTPSQWFSVGITLHEVSELHSMVGCSPSSYVITCEVVITVFISNYFINRYNPI